MQIGCSAYCPVTLGMYIYILTVIAPVNQMYLFCGKTPNQYSQKSLQPSRWLPPGINNIYLSIYLSVYLSIYLSVLSHASPPTLKKTI